MKIIHAESYDDLSRKAAEIIAAQIKSKPDGVLGLATGSSPVGTYKELVKMYESGELDFSRISSINLDEYVGLDGTSDQSYRFFMNDNLFDHVNIDKSNTNVPNGKAEDREYFIGLPGYQQEPPFVPSLPVEFRKRLTVDIQIGRAHV